MPGAYDDSSGTFKISLAPWQNLVQLQNVQGREASRAHWLHSNLLVYLATSDPAQCGCALETPTTLLVLSWINTHSTVHTVAQRKIMDETYTMNHLIDVQDFGIHNTLVPANI